MKLPGMKMDSPLMSLSKQLGDERVEQFDDVDAEAIIEIEQAYIDFHSKYDEKFPGRPYLVFTGVCKELQGDLPFGITSLPFYNDNFIKSDVIYDFSDDELSTLAKQGLFNKGFKVPEDFIGAEINAPVKCSMTVIKPELEDSVPLVFASIHNNRMIAMDTENSDWAFGYEFDDLVIEDTYDFEDDFIDDKSFEDTFGPIEEEPVYEEEVQEEPEVDEELERSVADIYKRAKEREERIRREFAAKKAAEEEKVSEVAEEKKDAPGSKEDAKESIKEDKEESKDLDNQFDESEFEEFEGFDESFENNDVSKSEKDAEDTRRKVQKIDRAEDLQEENEKDEYVRRLADSTGISESEAERELGE